MGPDPGRRRRRRGRRGTHPVAVAQGPLPASRGPDHRGAGAGALAAADDGPGGGRWPALAALLLRPARGVGLGGGRRPRSPRRGPAGAGVEAAPRRPEGRGHRRAAAPPPRPLRGRRRRGPAPLPEPGDGLPAPAADPGPCRARPPAGDPGRGRGPLHPDRRRPAAGAAGPPPGCARRGLGRGGGDPGNRRRRLAAPSLRGGAVHLRLRGRRGRRRGRPLPRHRHRSARGHPLEAALRLSRVQRAPGAGRGAGRRRARPRRDRRRVGDTRQQAPLRRGPGGRRLPAPPGPRGWTTAPS